MRRELRKIAVRAGRFLGISDLSQSVADAHARLDAQQQELQALRRRQGDRASDG
jgi:hypothetical protein